MAKRGRNIGAWIIIGLLSFGLVGFGASGLSGRIRTVGTVGEKPISVQQYANALSNQLRSLSAQLGVPVGLAQAQAAGLDRAVLGQLVATRALDNEVSEMGLSVGDEEVRNRVIAAPQFAGLDGQFSRDQYRLALESAGLTEEEYETQERESAARALLQAAVISGVAEPEAYADALTAYIGERRDVTWIAVTEADVEFEAAEPGELDLLAYYEANPSQFTSPELRQITYAWLTPEMIQDAVTVDEEALRGLYEERIDQYVQPERRLVERLVMPSAEAAEAARAALDAGETDFEAMVEERGLDLAAVDMGDVAADELGAASEPVFAAEPGDVVGPVETSLGPAFFRVNAVLSAQEVTFEEARGDLREELAAARARRIIQDATEGLTDLLAGGATVEVLAEQSDLELGQIDWAGGQTDGIAAYEEFRLAAAEAEEGDFAELIELEDGGVFALRLDGVIPPELIPLEDVRAEVAEGWQAEALRTAVLERAQALADEAPVSGPFTLGARAATTETGLIRRDTVPGTSPQFMPALFDMELEEVRMIPTPEGAIVMRLDAIAPADMESETMSAEREAIADRVSAGIANDIYQIFAGEIQLQTDVNINEAAINAVHANFQ